MASPVDDELWHVGTRESKGFCEAGDKNALVTYTVKFFYDSPPHASDGFKNRFRAFFPSFLFFLLVRPVDVDVIVIASLSCILFFNLAACSDKYS